MPTLSFRHGLAGGIAATTIVWMFTIWVAAQSDDALRRAQEELARQMGGKVYSGADIGFRAVGLDRGTPAVVPVVKIDGQWVEVKIGMPGMVKLTQ